jgi:hypothetical protein
MGYVINVHNLAPNNEGYIEQCRYSSMHSEPWDMLVSGHIYAAVPTKQEAG